MEGEVKSNESEYKGQTLSANLPWKVQFAVPAPDGGKDIKVLAHLVSGRTSLSKLSLCLLCMGRRGFWIREARGGVCRG
jgi:hypothetical protein